MSSHYQSLSLHNDSFLLFWSKCWFNPHLSQPSVSDSVSYNMDLNPCPLGPQTLLRRRIYPETAQVILIPSAFEPPAHTLTALLKHLQLHSDILCQSWVLLALPALGHWMGEQQWCWGFWRLIAFTPLPHPSDKTCGLCYCVAGQCLIAKAQQQP